ncbi:MAG: PDZ domain-containing protein [Planctomycetes bacterium]|nr:PDZ domain-containing protein [Planctomycetota bacterium]
MLVRIVNMRGVDLNVFDFDFDLTWAALFTNADGYTYGRYGSRDAGNAEKGLSLKALKYAMKRALAAYQAKPALQPAKRIAESAGLPRRIELYPAARRVKKGSCLHCHQVHNFQIDLHLSKKTWSKDRMWLYPPPSTLGLTLDLDRGDSVKSVVANSAADTAGLNPGDVLTHVNGVAVASAADVRYLLNRAPKSGTIPIRWQRSGRAMTGRLALAPGWRKSDISWRASMWTMPPAMGIYGRNLTAAEKRRLNLVPKRLAFRQGNYVPPHTRRAGIRARDIIIGVDGKKLEMTMLQFNVYMRSNYNVGDRVVFNIIRGNRRLKIPMTLPVNPR